MKTLTIIRGISGSGKSFLAQKIRESSKDQVPCYVEADWWHHNLKGDYVFDVSEIKNAHDWCRLTCEYYLKIVGHVIVANTFTTINEIMPYVQIAIKYGARLEILEPQTEWFNNVEECVKRNVHKVPKEVLIKQKNRYVFIRTGYYSPEILADAPNCFHLNQE